MATYQEVRKRNLSADMLPHEAYKALGIVKADDKPHVSHNSGENEWYTPAIYIEAARLQVSLPYKILRSQDNLHARAG